MSLANWFKHTKTPESSKRLDDLLAGVAGYLQSHPEIDDFFPNLVGKALGESELVALTALSILESKGITKPHYGVYCPNRNVILEEYDSLDAIPSELPCKLCDEEHSSDYDGWKVELFFTVDRHRLKNFTSGTKVA